MRRIGVRTQNFRLSFQVLKELKRRKCDFVMLSAGDSWDGVLITSPEEAKGGDIPAIEDDVEIAVERAIHAGKGLDSAYKLKFGVDPGPRPGLAWLADGIVIGSAQLQSLDRLAEHIIGIATAVEHARMSVNVGDGAPMIRDQIINQLIISGIETYQVDEYKTSIGSRSKAHIHAATRIALMGGIRVNNVRELKPTIGDLKEIQRQSRIHSSGDLTISTELARRVACGEITMDEAIRRA